MTEARTVKRSGGSPADVSIQNPNRYRDVRPRVLSQWLSGLLAELAPDVDSFAVKLVGDRAMSNLNREYRSRRTTTDVLSFPGEVSVEGRHLGDVAISVPAARRQAKAAGHSVDRELRTLLLHGVLHCLGYDHETDGGEMDELERRLRRRWVSAVA